MAINRQPISAKRSPSEKIPSTAREDDFIGTYFHTIAQTPLLTREQEVQLARQMELGCEKIANLLSRYPVVVQAVLEQLNDQGGPVRGRPQKKRRAFVADRPL